MVETKNESPQQSRLVFSPPFILLITVIIVIGSISTFMLGEYAKRLLVDDARIRVESLVNLVELEFAGTIDKVSIIAHSPQIFAPLREVKDGDYDEITDALNRFRQVMQVELCFVTNAAGIVVATSDVPQEKVFVGEDLSFRPYFQHAIQGSPYEYLAIGTTTKTPGLYAAYPIYQEAGRIIGVAVIKRDLKKIKAYLAQFAHCFVVNRDGVIFLSSSDAYEQRWLWPVSEETQERIKDSRQFGLEALQRPLLSKEVVSGEYQALEGFLYYLVREEIGAEGWSVVMLMSAKLIMLYKLVGILATLFFVGVCVGFIVILSLKDRSAHLLLESEKRYSALFESSSDAIFLINRNGIFDCNNEALTMFTIGDKTKLHGCCPSEMCVPMQPDGQMSQQYMQQKIRETFDAGKTEFEFLFHRADGKIFVADVRMKSFIINDEEIIRATIRDVTERRTLEESLRKLSRAVEQSPSCVVITDLEGNIEYVNSKFTELTGYSFEEVKGQNPRILKSGNQVTEFYQDLWHTILAGNEWRGEFNNKKKNGELYWEFAVISPIIDEARGIATHFVALKEDITPRKEAEAALRDSEEKYRGLFEDSNDAIFIHTPAGDMVDVNQCAAMMTGYTIDELRSMRMQEIHVETDRSMEKIIETVLRDGTFLTETQMRRKDGSVFAIEISLSVVGGHLKKIQGIVRDITERKKVEKLKDDFVSTVSHELRTPLTIIREGTALVMDGIAGELNTNQKNILTTTQQNVDRLSRLIDDLLDMSKIEAGKFDLKKTWFDLGLLVKDMKAAFESKAQSRGLELRVAVPDAAVPVFADRDKIIQVFMNLIGNAVKFTDAGYIEIRCREHDGVLECLVSDTGRGLREQDIAQLFEKFKQFGRKEGAGEKGTGLGLSIVKGIVGLHNGKVTVKSKYGVGTTFAFTLPKYTERMVFTDALTDTVKRASQADLEMSAVRFTQVTMTVSAEDIADSLRTHLLRSDDAVYCVDDSVCIVLFDCGYTAAQKVVKRMLETVGADMLQYKKIRYAVFPHDGSSAKDICDVLF